MIILNFMQRISIAFVLYEEHFISLRGTSVLRLGREGLPDLMAITGRATIHILSTGLIFMVSHLTSNCAKLSLYFLREYIFFQNNGMVLNKFLRNADYRINCGCSVWKNYIYPESKMKCLNVTFCDDYGWHRWVLR